MAAERRCRRCGGPLTPGAAFCGRCGTKQVTAQRWTASGRDELVEPRPGWYVDPFGRSPYRYWDGGTWTEHVYASQYGIDALSIDHLRADQVPDGAWRATIGSLGLTLGGLAVAFGLSFLAILPFLLTGHPGGPIVGLLCSEVGLWTGLAATCVVTSRRYGTGNVRRDFRVRFRWIDLGIGLGASIAARCVAAAVLVPFLHVLHATGNPDRSLYAITSLGAIGWAVLAVLTCVGAPILEELYFRGLLQGQLVERYGPTVAVGVTSLCFGAAHIANNPGVAGVLLGLSIGAGGIVLGTVRHLSGRLGTSIATHAWFNATAILALALVTTR